MSSVNRKAIYKKKRKIYIAYVVILSHLPGEGVLVIRDIILMILK